MEKMEFVYICVVIGLPILVYCCIDLDKEIKIVLGSSSSARKQVLDYSQIEYISVSADIDETLIKNDDPKQLVLDIASFKAIKLGSRLNGEDCILITADQIVLNKSEIYLKPIDKKEANKFLQSYSNKSVKTVTGIVATNMLTGKIAKAVDVSTIYFDEITDKEIEQICIPEFQSNIWEKTQNFLFLPHYIPLKKKIYMEKQKVNVFDCCGALAIEHPVFLKKIRKIEGTVSSVLGLPLNVMLRLIEVVK